MLKPVSLRTRSASAIITRRASNSFFSLTGSARRSPATNTNTGSPSARKSNDLTMLPRAVSSASAANCAVRALSTCGDLASVTAIAPFARSGAYFNGLTGTAIDALAAIAKRDPAARAAVRRVVEQLAPGSGDVTVGGDIHSQGDIVTGTKIVINSSPTTLADPCAGLARRYLSSLAQQVMELPLAAIGMRIK